MWTKIPFTEIKIKENRNYSLIAKYRDLKKYTIHLEGFDDIEFYEDNFDITLPTPVKEGHKFIGWYENDKLITEINENRDYDLKAAYDDWLPWV